MTVPASTMRDTYAYYDNASPKTRVLNALRRVFLWRPLENLLARASRGKEVGSFTARLIPQEYLYPKGSWRMVHRNGADLKLDLSDAVDHYIYFGLAEPGYARLFALVRNGAQVIDVGANIGMLTLPLARAVGNGRVVSFEPDPVNRARLEEHLEMNRVGNVTVLPFGLGAEAGRSELYKVVDTNSGMNRILTGPVPAHAYPHSTIEVRRLDDLWPELGLDGLDVLKVDVEGFELSVLRGAARTIERHKPVLFIELDDDNLRENGSSAAHLVQWLHDRGYAVEDAIKGVPIRAGELEHCHLDILCTMPR